MRVDGCSRAKYRWYSQKLAMIILLDVGLASKAPKREIGRFLLSFCFALKQFSERDMHGSISAQGVQ